MEKLIKGTTAYKIFSKDVKSGRLSHAYLLHLADRANLRNALKGFAAGFFPAELSARIKNESFTDFAVYPKEGGKISVEGVSAIIAESALRPVEGDKKLFVITDFDTASALVQNKLLKTLEEPPADVYFLLGAVTLATVLDTVKSRVKLLEIPPFSEREIFAALQRQGENPLNARAAADCGGILGEAQAMVSGGWYQSVRGAAEEICNAVKISQIAPAVKKYGDTKYKEQLLAEMQNVYFSRLKNGGEGGLSEHALIFALERLPRAFADLKFNAFFQGLLYDFMLEVIEENDKWQKLQA